VILLVWSRAGMMVSAVLRNKRVMLVWALLIVGLTAAGFATAFVGLIVVMPWLAYSSWHAYLETLDSSGWPELPIARPGST